MIEQNATVLNMASGSNSLIYNSRKISLQSNNLVDHVGYSQKIV